MSVPTPDSADILHRVARFLLSRPFRIAVAWLIALALGGQRWNHAWHCFDTAVLYDGMKPEELDKIRADGNNGHTQIDFGGQWVFGRMAATGHLGELYNREWHWKIAAEGYKLESQSPAVRNYSRAGSVLPEHLKSGDATPDSTTLFGSMMGNTKREAEHWDSVAQPVGIAFAGMGGSPFVSAAHLQVASETFTPEKAEEFQKPLIGGPLYPPVHAFLYAPIGAIPNPQTAYFLFQFLAVLACFGAALAVRYLTRGRVWWSVAASLILIFPGIRCGIDLGQNNPMTLMIVLWGWALAARGHELAGGGVWGMLAFKPVWGLAFILAPILLRKWKFVLGTAIVGCSFVLFTLPFVGLHAWVEWFEIGKDAAALYNVDDNWIPLSRDISGIPKRLFLDFSIPRGEREDKNLNLACNVLLGVIALTTVAVFLLRSRLRHSVGLSAGFLLLGSYLCCYRFMYYDTAMIAVGLAALLADPRWTLWGWRGALRLSALSTGSRRVKLFVNSVPLTFLAALLFYENVLSQTGFHATVQAGQFQRFEPDKPPTSDENGNPKGKMVLRKLSYSSDYNHPTETVLALLLWGWCGWRLIRDGRRADWANC